MTLLDAELIEHERSRTLAVAEKIVSKLVPQTIVSIINPRSPGDQHDFSSEADYWWPNPDDPDGAFIQRDGLSNPNNFTAHRELLLNFAEQVGSLAAAALLSHDTRYADAAMAHLNAWFVNPATRMNPDLQYAQAIQGVCTGRAIGLIDTVHLAEVALAAHRLRQANMISAHALRPIIDWFAQYLKWLCTHPYGIEESHWPNNHGTCWALQAAAFAKLTDNTHVSQDCRQRLKEVLIPLQMAPDGSFPKELARTKPYSYSIFNLDVMTALAEILSSASEDLVSWSLPDGRSLIKAVQFLAPYLKNKAHWPYPHDVMHWDDWPLRQPALLFAGRSAKHTEWLELWKSMPPASHVLEVRRNFPVRNPILWLER